VAPDVDAGNGAEAERVKGVSDRLALRVEEATTRDDVNGDTEAGHSFDSDEGRGRSGVGSGSEGVGDAPGEDAAEESVDEGTLDA
jgi:hypothetical protein